MQLHRQVTTFLWVFALALAARLPAADFSATWGGTDFVFPMPAGYADGSDSLHARLAQGALPASNELIGTYTTEDPTAYAMVQGFVPSKTANITRSDFKQVTASVKQMIANPDPETQALISQVIDKAEAATTELLGEQFKIKSSRPLLFDVFDESPAHVSFLMLMRVETELDGVKTSVPMAISATIVNLKGKMLYVYFSQAFKSRETYADLKANAKKIIPLFIAKNQE